MIHNFILTYLIVNTIIWFAVFTQWMKEYNSKSNENKSTVAFITALLFLQGLILTIVFALK